MHKINRKMKFTWKSNNRNLLIILQLFMSFVKWKIHLKRYLNSCADVRLCKCLKVF